MIRSSSPLLISGVLASATFVLADVLASTIAAEEHSSDGHRQYSMTHNSISELLIPDITPTLARTVGITLMSASDILGMIFGFCGILQVTNRVVELASRSDQSKRGSRRSTKHDRSSADKKISFEQRLQIRSGMYRGGLFLGLASFCNLASALIFPQDVRGQVSTFAGRMHLILVAGSVLLSLTAMYFLAGAIRSHSFQQFTLLVVSLMFAGGIFSPLAEGFLGVAERLAAYAYVTWQAVLAIQLIYLCS